MRLLLHIGTEKTGTTSIQQLLHVNRDVLLAAGIHVLRAAGAPNHRWLSAWAIPDDRDDDFFARRGIAREERATRRAAFHDRLHAELATLPAHVHTIVASSEHLHSRLGSTAEVAAVRDLLAPYADEVRVVCYLREQADLCASLYSTALKVGMDVGLETFVEQCTSGNPYYDYDLLLGFWREVFGEDALDVRLFDRSWLAGGDLISDFTRLLGLPEGHSLVTGVTQNESLTPAGQLVARAANRAFPGGPLGEDARRASILALAVERLAGPGAQLDPADRARTRAEFAASNEAVRARWFADLPTLVPHREPRAADERTDSIVDALAEALRRASVAAPAPAEASAGGDTRPPRSRAPWRRRET